jgi:hypothetical protein
MVCASGSINSVIRFIPGSINKRIGYLLPKLMHKGSKEGRGIRIFDSVFNIYDLGFICDFGIIIKAYLLNYNLSDEVG